jgi:hypothetical protein
MLMGPTQPTLTRAKFLVVAAAAYGGAVAAMPGCSPRALPPDLPVPGTFDPFGGAVAFWQYAFRADDFTQIALGFENLRPRPCPGAEAIFHPKKRWVLVRQHAGPAYIIVALPPQHVAEQSFAAASTVGAQLAASRLAGWSRLAFIVPDDVATSWDDGIPFNLDHVLEACSGFDLAVPQPQPTTDYKTWSLIRDPRQTAIEYPFRLQLAPHANARFVLRNVVAGGRADERPAAGVPSSRIEAWHARLAGPSSASPLPTLFAAYSIFPSVNAGDPENMEQGGQDAAGGSKDCDAAVVFGMRAQDRTALVKYTGARPQPNAEPATAIQANRLVLTTGGAEADLRFSRPRAPQDDGLDLTAWTHRASLGRDDFVELVYPGTLFPYGHKASYIERIQRTANAGQAILQSSAHIRIEEPVKAFSSQRTVSDPKNPVASSAQQFAATRIEIVEQETPDIDVVSERLDVPAVNVCDYPDLKKILPPYPLAFVPLMQRQVRQKGKVVTGGGTPRDYRFHLRRTDHDGRTVETRETLIFCSDGIAAIDRAAPGVGIAKRLAAAVQAAYSRPAVLAPDEIAPVPPDRHAVVGDLALVADAANPTSPVTVYRCIAAGTAGTISPGSPPPAPPGAELFAIWAPFIPQRNFVLLRNQLFAFAPTPHDVKELLTQAGSEATDEALRESATVLAAQWIQLQPTIEFSTGLDKAVHTPWAPAAQVKIDALRKILGREVEAAVAFVRSEGAILNATKDAFYDVLDTVKNTRQVFARMRDRVAIDLQQQERSLEQRARSAVVDLVSDAVGLGAVQGVIHGNFADTVQHLGADVPKALANLIDTTQPVMEVAQLFKDFHSKILGFIDIGLLIDSVAVDVINQAHKIPKIVNSLRNGVAVTSYDYTTEITQDAGPFLRGPGQCTLDFHSEVSVALQGAATHVLTCSIQNFRISLAGVVTLPFSQLTLVQQGQSPPRVQVDMGLPEFGGPFALLNNSFLKSLFSAFGSGFNIGVSPSAIIAAMAFHIPSINLGAFSISNLNFDLSAFLPIVRQPAVVQLGLGSARNRFMVGVGIFGGGGFLTLGFSLEHAATTLEGAIEFGGYLALNLFVAEGEAHLTAGIGFKIDGEGFEVAGFVRCGGHMSVLGLISVSIEFYLELRYAKSGGRTVYRGTCEVQVEVSVLFFSTTVTLRFEKSFDAGGDAQAIAQLAYEPHVLSDVPRGSGALRGDRPHSVAATLREAEWREYCDAFAA